MSDEKKDQSTATPKTTVVKDAKNEGTSNTSAKVSDDKSKAVEGQKTTIEQPKKEQGNKTAPSQPSEDKKKEGTVTTQTKVTTEQKTQASNEIQNTSEDQEIEKTNQEKINAYFKLKKYKNQKGAYFTIEKGLLGCPFISIEKANARQGKVNKGVSVEFISNPFYKTKK